MIRDRKGFTIIEMLIVTVLGALVVGAALQVLVTNRRTYTAQSATIAGQQSTRMAVEVLFAELREVSSGGGDIIDMEDDSLRVRLMRKFSVVCATDLYGVPPRLSVIDSFGPQMVLMGGANAFAAGDSVFVFADNDPDIDRDDVWIPAEITQVIPTTVCPQNLEGATDLVFQGQGALFTTDSVGMGAGVRSYLEYTFGTTVMNGDTYLGRRTGSGRMIPVTGPLQDTDGLVFEYLDSVGAVTSDEGEVRQIVVTVRTGSEVLNSIGRLVQDSVRVTIFTRN